MDAASQSFLLIFRESTPERYEAMTRDERRRALADWNAWCDRLAAEGRLQSGHPLMPEGRVVSRANAGQRIDGPFAEAKEMIGGYFFINAANMDEATSIAEGSPNLKYGMTVEVRPIAGGCHLARSLGLKGMREPAEASSTSSSDSAG
ncbi:MAG TPA: YciI family protein [Gemmatimonadaceae bacterium]|nr:YciI family protein [Gemmatimonadaceae bacterium]